ncbi:MAG: SHOCT domain-containing protein [Phycisphaerales bacterium]
MLSGWPMLAARAGGSSSVASAVGWILALIAVAVVLGLVLMRLRRVYLRPGDGDEGAPLPVSELRRLRDEGQLSEEEFQRALAVMTDRAKGSSGAQDTE